MTSHRVVAPLRFFATLSLAAVLAAAPVAGHAHVQDRLTSSGGQVFALSRPEVPGIHRYAELEPGLARGANPSDEGIAYLKSKGFKTVVAFWTGPNERERLKKAGIDLVEIPIRSSIFAADAPTHEQIERFLQIVDDPARRPVFIHCRKGRDRTGAMAAIYRMERSGWRRADALEEMKAFGFHGHYRKLLRFVADYPAPAVTSSAPAAP